MRLIDISRPLTSDLAPWPGDTPFDYQLTARITEGSSVNVGRVVTSLHSGTHADSYFHFNDRGQPIDRSALDRYLGPAVVVDLSARFGVTGAEAGQITTEELQASEQDLKTAPRLLIKTGVWPDSTRFPEAIPTIAPEAGEWLGRRGVKLLGVDLPSVDALDSKDLPNHHALETAGVAIVEGLDLARVDRGIYWFSALPLKIIGGDGAPVRAVLWRE